VPDQLWQHCDFGVGKIYADDQADDIARDETEGLAKFDAWTEAFAGHVQARGPVPGTEEAVKAAKSTTNQ
jgi:hypothetical protein